MKLATTEQIRGLDRVAMEDYLIPGLLLMENAGRGTVTAMTERFGDLAGRTVAIVVGPGNNGGDGLVIARHLLQRGGLPLVFLLLRPEKLKGDAATNLAIVSRLDIPLFQIDDPEKIGSLANCLPGCDLIVDAIFGTGLTRKPAGHFATAIEIINSSNCPVISVDIPSGLNSDTGQLSGTSVRAEMTATYGLAKPGHFLGEGPEYTGELEIIDIGLPARALSDANLQIEMLDTVTVREWLPHRPVSSHKGSFGHLLVVAGSLGMSGAALLCARGALRSGAGLVSLAAPERLQAIFATALPEAMIIPLETSGAGHVTPEDLEAIMAATQGKSAVVLGPGLGRDQGTGAVVAELFRNLQIPMLVDADGLNLLADLGVNLGESAAPRILTPHPGEMSRLTGIKVARIQGDRMGVASDFAIRHKVFLVLKGNGTVIASPEGVLAINPTGNPLLSVGGSGDVLAGLIGGLLAQGLSPWESAGLAAFIHGSAADRHFELERTSSGLLASELADQVPLVMADLRSPCTQDNQWWPEAGT